MAHHIAKHDKNIETPTMLYRHPGPHKIDDDFYDYCIVDASEVDATVKDGWSKTLAEAKNKSRTIKEDDSKEEIITPKQKRRKKKHGKADD